MSSLSAFCDGLILQYYCYVIKGINKSDSINLIQNVNLSEKNETLYKKKNFKYEMVEKIVTFDDIEILKHKFHHNKNPIF